MDRRLPISQDFSRQVNRHLAAAHFFLSQASQQVDTLNPMQLQACIESILFQAQLCLRIYLDELLSYYQKPVLTIQIQQLGELFENESAEFSGISEFSELKQWLLQKDKPWRELCDYPRQLLNTEDLINKKRKPERSSTEPDVGVEIIAVTQEDELLDFLEMQTVRLLVNELQQLIDRQRENQVES